MLESLEIFQSVVILASNNNNMCIHKSQDFYRFNINWDGEDFSNLKIDFEYCDGSRFRCDGCHCRYPALEFHTGKCWKCRTINFTIMDIIAEERGKLYTKYYVFKEANMTELVDLEIEITKKVWELFEKEEQNILSPMLRNYFARQSLQERTKPVAPEWICDQVRCIVCCFVKDQKHYFLNPLSELKKYFERTTALMTKIVCEQFIYENY